VFGFPKERARPLVVAALEAYYPRISIIFARGKMKIIGATRLSSSDKKILGGL